MKGVSFNSEFNTIINQFNAKVKQLRNQGMRFIPDEVDKQQLRETYQYDQPALKRKLLDLQKFMDAGAERIITLEGGAKTTVWEYESVKREAQANKSYLSKEINRYGKIVPKVYGKKQDATYAQMGDATYENMIKTRESLDKAKFETQQDWRRYIQKNRNLTKRRMTQDYVFKENYIEFIQVAGQDANIDPELLHNVIDKMSMIDAHDFYDIYQEEKAMQDITQKYDIVVDIHKGLTENGAKVLNDDLEYLNKILEEYVEDLGIE